MKIIRIDRIGECERRLEVEFDGDDASQFRRAAGLVFEAGDITHISIHVPREGHDAFTCIKYKVFDISIHVPREGHDTAEGPPNTVTIISIHVPREGHDGYRCS